MKKKVMIYTAAGAAVYALLLAALTVSERACPGAVIRTLGDAFWFSLVTMTTVGYGDLYPVSVVGRGIGFIFLLCSLGVLAALVAAGAAVIRGRLLPLLRLRFWRKKQCWLFSEVNDMSRALAQNLRARDQDCRLLFCDAENQTVPMKNVLCLSRDVIQTARIAADRGLRFSIILTKESAPQNDADAQALQDLAAPIYCRGPETDALPQVRFFDGPECAARQYWQRYPLAGAEERILLAGDGALARALLDQAVLINCRVPFSRTEYHLFGGWEAYRSLHPALRRVFDYEGKDTETDGMIFHREAWTDAHDLIARVDRIIFCADTPEINAENALLLRRYYASSARVYAAAPSLPALYTAFGLAEELYTPELVMKGALDARARALHAAYLDKTGGGTAWEQLSPFARASNRAAADHLLTKLRLLLPEDPPDRVSPEACRLAADRWHSLTDREPWRECEHARWMRFHCLYNWQYGDKKDAALRLHPCLVPYAALSEEERIKDDSAWEQIGSLEEKEEKLG